MKATKIVDRWIPEDSTAVEHPQGLGIVYCYTKRTGLPTGPGEPTGIAYSGIRRKADWHYIFGGAQGRREEIKEYFKRLTDHQTVHQAVLAERAEARKQPHTLLPGQIIVNSWGCYRTNVDYYQILRVSNRFVWLRQIAADRTVTSHRAETSFMGGTSVPIKDRFLEDTRVEKHGVRMDSGDPRVNFKHGSGCVSDVGGRQWDGCPQHWSAYADGSGDSR
jgi:hypothetical protein